MAKVKKRSSTANAAGSKKKTTRKAGGRKKKHKTAKPTDSVETTAPPPEPVAPALIAANVGFSEGILATVESKATAKKSAHPKTKAADGAGVSESGDGRREKPQIVDAQEDTRRAAARRKAADGAGGEAGATQPKPIAEQPGREKAPKTTSGSGGGRQRRTRADRAGKKRRTRAAQEEVGAAIGMDDSDTAATEAAKTGASGKSVAKRSGKATAARPKPEPSETQPTRSASPIAAESDTETRQRDRGGRRSAKRPERKPVAKSGERKSAEQTASSERTASLHREMLINVSDGDECRIAMLRGGRLEELYIERATATSNVGNIYKGRVTNVESSIQAAFIDFGLPSHGFLHISDLHPKYFSDGKHEPEQVGKKTPRRHRPPIQQCLRPGQEVIVQVIKEGIGTKGPTLSSYISLPGRFLVMMPDMKQLGVSRKIEDEDQRRKMRDLLGQLSLPKDMGFILRTAGVDRTKRDLQRDLNYLSRLWKKVEQRNKTEPAPAELYKESDLVIRTIRDVYDSSLKRIIVDSPEVTERVREFLAIASPRSQDIVKPYEDMEPMFHRYGIESEIDKLHSRQVPLPCGGSLVIEQTEALVAIDVNSGRFRIPENAEETAYRVNIEAVDEIARQLRLRDMGGLIILDLIDMGYEKHRRAVERRVSDALKKHKERAKILRISKFGILEMTRQRQRPSFAKSMFRDCPRCGGSGRIKAVESVALDIMRQIRLASHKQGVVSIDARVNSDVANTLLNRKRHHLTDLERATGQTIRIHGEDDFTVDEVRMSCTDRRGREVPGAGNWTTTHSAATSNRDAFDRTAPKNSERQGGRSKRPSKRRR